jgi:integrase/recombinase XerC
MSLKLDSAVNSFLRRYDNPLTRASYESILLELQASVGNKRLVTNIRPIDLSDYITDLQNRDVKYAEHARRPALHEKLSPYTIRKHVKTLKAFFNWLVDMEELKQSPMRNISAKRLPQAIPRNKMATDDEILEIKKVAYGNPFKRAIFDFLCETGCRAGGVADLQIAKLNIPAREATITEKGSKTREVWFGDECAESLERWLKVRPAVEHDYVFASPRSPHNPLKSQSVQTIIERLASTAGIERPFHPHHIRHWKADKLSQVTDVVTSALVLGHEDPVVTMHFYYHENKDRAREAIRQTSFRPDRKLPANVVSFERLDKAN